MATIEIEVGPEAATAYTTASTQAQRKVQLLLNTWLPALDGMSKDSLREIMDQMSDEAEANGLTDEILESILHDQD